MLHRQLVVRIERRHLVTLCQCRIIEYRAQKVVQPTAEVEYSLPNVNEFSRTGPDRMDSKQTPVFAMKDEFHQTTVVTKNLSSRDLSIPGDPGFVGNVLLRQVMLWWSSHGYFRDCVNTHGQVLGERIDVDPESVTGDLPTLRGGRRRKAGVSDDVARSKNVGNLSPELSIDLQPTSLIGRQPGGSQVELISRSYSSDRVQHAFRYDALAGLEGHHGSARQVLA